MESDEIDYASRVSLLDEELSGPDPDERIRRIAREEADKRIQSWAVLCAFCALAYYHGWQGVAAGVAVAIAWLFIRTMLDDRSPATDRHLIVRHAEDLIRLELTAEAHEAGDACWGVEEGYAGGKRKIVVQHTDRWDDAWPRIYAAAVKFRSLAVRQRRKALEAASRRALPALRIMAEMSRRERAEPVYWASSALERVDRRR